MFNVLSLDGGGIKGAFSAAVLAELETRLKRPIMECFDLVVGTSTGGILALGIASGHPASEIEDLYRNQALKIFPAGARTFPGWFEWWFQPKYEPDGLRNALTTTFGSQRFGDIKPRVAIPAFDATSGRPVVFRSPALEPTSRAHAMTTVEVALATSAAPTYFPAAKAQQRLLLDGGVWANCPVIVGIAEAIHTCERRPHTVQVISVGTTTEPFGPINAVEDGGRLDWAADAVTLFMRASKLGTLDLAKRFCGHVERVDDMVVPGQFKLDDVEGVEMLIARGHDAAEQQWKELQPLLTARKVE